jgi:hypothetical protein
MTTYVYTRDDAGHLYCECCGFKPKATERHPYGNPSTMHYHMKKHTNDFPYECSVCKSGFPQKQNLINHMKARHPNHLKEKDTDFKCPMNGCTFRSVTKGNCLVHCARRHFDEIVDSYLEIKEVNDVKTHHCLCCVKDFKSPTAFYYHILKCLNTYDLLETKLVDTLL